MNSFATPNKMFFFYKQHDIKKCKQISTDNKNFNEGFKMKFLKKLNAITYRK